jgi:hypothetical protein
VSRAWRKGLDLLGLQQDATKGGRMAKPELNSMQAAALVQLNMHTGGAGGQAWEEWGAGRGCVQAGRRAECKLTVDTSLGLLQC